MSTAGRPQLSLFPPTVDTAAHTDAAWGPREYVRVLTANVQHASPVRTHRQATWLATRHDHDVLVLTEVSAGQSGELTAHLLDESGYHVHLPRPGHDPYRVLVAVRGRDPHTADVTATGVQPRDMPVLGMDVVDVGVAVMPHRCVAVRVALPQGEIGVVGLYVPSRGPRAQRNIAKRAFQDAVAAVLPELRKRLDVDGPVVLTGDFNVVEPDHRPRYPVFGQWEYDFYRAFAAAGFADAFRLTTPQDMDYSWYGRAAADGTRNGYRFDHTFITAEHADRVRDCHYVHAIRDQRLTDHSAMALTLDARRPVPAQITGEHTTTGPTLSSISDRHRDPATTAPAVESSLPRPARPGRPGQPASPASLHRPACRWALRPVSCPAADSAARRGAVITGSG